MRTSGHLALATSSVALFVMAVASSGIAAKAAHGQVYEAQHGGASAPEAAKAQTNLRAGAATPAQEPIAQAKAILAEMGARQFDNVTAQFNAPMAAGLSAEQLSKGWDTISAMAG